MVIAVSYATQIRKFTQAGTNLNTYDCLDITYEETTEDIAMTNS